MPLMRNQSLETMFAGRKGKLSDKWSLYLSEYARLFKEFRNKKISLLEIGIQNGGSLEVWSEYFERAKILIGCDINPDCANLNFHDPRIRVIVGDANSSEVKSELYQASAEYDIIIDDGSHKSSDIVKSFVLYFPALAMGGIYIVEDLHCSYWREFEGGLFDPYSSISFFKRIADVLNYEHWGIGKSREDVFLGFFEKYQCSIDPGVLSQIHSIEFINSICVIRKRDNSLNGLGSRVISGEDELVVAGHIDLNNKTYELDPIFSQHNNHWSNRVNPPDEDTLFLEQQLVEEQQEKALLQEQKASLEQQLVEEQQEKALLQEQKASLEQDIAYSEYKNNSLITSTSWKITIPLRWVGGIAKKAIRLLNRTFRYFLDVDLYKKIPNAIALLKKEGWKRFRDILIEELLEYDRRKDTIGSEFKILTTVEGININDSKKRVAYRVDKTANILKQDDLLVYVAYSPTGHLSKMQDVQIQQYKSIGYKVALIINTDNFQSVIDSGFNHSDIQVTRENIGFDFGAWKDFINIVGNLEIAKSITFTNDSLCIISSEKKLFEQKNNIDKLDADIVFLTKNNEISPHYQSYFFCIKKHGLSKNALDVLGSLEYFIDKDRLISEVEINLHLKFADRGIAIQELYVITEGDGATKNPTIHCWKELLEMGFPYFKIQILTSGILNIESPDIRSSIGEDVTSYIDSHCAIRNNHVQIIQKKYRRSLSEKSIPITRIFNKYGAQQALNPVNEHLLTVKLPFSDIDEIQINLPKILAVIHCYYLDVAKIIIREISQLGIPMRLLLTTDSQEKQTSLVATLEKLGLEGTVVLSENRGRDVAPFVIETKKYITNEEIILHLHTKKSKHNEKYSEWGDFLRENLIGSTAIVKSILKILEQESIGVVYSEHYGPVKDLRNWGYDFSGAKKILKRIGVEVSGENLLEFPTSTMFWAKRAAIEPLLTLGLDYSDFEPEEGQTDGTLAHSIERSLLFIAEKSGYSSLLVSANEG